MDTADHVAEVCQACVDAIEAPQHGGPPAPVPAWMAELPKEALQRFAADVPAGYSPELVAALGAVLVNELTWCWVTEFCGPEFVMALVEEFRSEVES